ncbi:hypothetical protein [Kineosporia babensis]|uniref:Uncharacterized protein n=1 Tax=Kineosporia babensis TaxID=499548 RepID=A0A9X1NCH9_9ACTN|nr:hypothetical protein [Kineosporia babensis]MCD5311175.1 hypothetical protein [Kineosporia babensis]
MANTQSPVVLHVEIVHPNPDAAAGVIHADLGAEQVEPQTAAQIEKLAEGLRVILMRVGGVVFQIVRPVPIPGLNAWYEHYQEHGAGVHTVSPMSRDAEAVQQAERDLGARWETVGQHLELVAA